MALQCRSHYSNCHYVGKVDAIQHFSNKYGPGLRYVVFISNDTGSHMSTNTIVSTMEKAKSCYGSTGGVTVTGHEPCIQHRFISQLFQEVKGIGLTTCLDMTQSKLEIPDTLLDKTDFVILGLTSVPISEQEHTIQLWKLLEEKQIPYIVKYIIKPGPMESELVMAHMISNCRFCKRVEIVSAFQRQ